MRTDSPVRMVDLESTANKALRAIPACLVITVVLVLLVCLVPRASRVVPAHPVFLDKRDVLEWLANKASLDRRAIPAILDWTVSLVRGVSPVFLVISAYPDFPVVGEKLDETEKSVPKDCLDFPVVLAIVVCLVAMVIEAALATTDLTESLALPAVPEILDILDSMVCPACVVPKATSALTVCLARRARLVLPDQKAVVDDLVIPDHQVRLVVKACRVRLVSPAFPV